MASERRDRTERELAEALQALAPRLRFPETPELAPAVRARIEQQAPMPIDARWRPARLVTVAAALVVLVVGTALAIPAGRDAMADWLDVPGVTLFADDAGEAPVLAGDLRLGDPVTLAEARSGVTFPALTPGLDWLGEPDEVYLDPRPIGGAISLVYHAGADLPAAEETGIGLLLTQFRGSLNPGMVGKALETGTEFEVLEINGRTAYWITGEPHSVSYINADGELDEETARLAGNTLLWQDGALTLRLESALDRETAIAIAESMR